MENFYWKNIHRSDTSASFRWGGGLCLVLILMPALGSVMSGVYGVLCLFALLYIINGYKFLKLTKAEIIIAVIFCLYVFVTLGFALAYDNPLEGLAITANNSGFIATLLLLPVVRKFCDDEPRWFEAGIIGSGIVLLVLAPVEFFAYPGNRVELLSSNPLVLSWMAGTIAIFNLSIVFSSTGRTKIFAGVALAGAVVAVIVAGGRGPIIALIITMAMLLAYHMRAMRMRVVVITVITGAIVIAGGLELAKDNRTLQVMQDRFVVGFQQLTGNDPGGRLSMSTRIRISYYTNGWRTFMEAPLAGHGRQNVMRDAVGDIEDTQIAAYKLTHLHNAYLTEAVATGILGVLMLLAVTITPIIAARGKPKRYMEMAVIFSLFTNLCFITNIGFYQDVMVFFFCAVVVVLNRQRRVDT